MTIGVDIGGTKIKIGKIADGRIVDKVCLPTNPFRSENMIIEDIINGINELIDYDVTGIGIGVPGLVDEAEGIIYNLNNIPSWQEVHLKKKIESYFSLPVYLSNDANCFVLGEKLFGKSQGFKNMVGITLGTGLGAGVIINNNIYSGTLSLAGEIGGIPYMDHNYEYYCSGKFFQQQHNLSARELYDNALTGVTLALEIFVEYGKHLGALIKTVLMAYAPEAVILGGSITKAYTFFKNTMMETINEFPHKKVLDNLIINDFTDEDISLLGAAALALAHGKNITKTSMRYEK